jgi:hypothetical protein
VNINRNLFVVAVAVIVAGCASSFASRYGVEKENDQFKNQTVVTMTGGVIDADYLGIVSNPAEFNPFVVRSNGKLVATGLKFSLEITNGSGWLNIKPGSKAIFLLDGGEEKIELEAAGGDFNYDVSSYSTGVYSTHYDKGVFVIRPDQIEKIANAKSVEVRVSGASAYIDFPRKPNNHVVDNFLPNWRKFYKSEVKPYL